MDTVARLINWSRRRTWGLARVEYSSEFARERVLSSLRYALAEQFIPLHEIELPSYRSASQIVQFITEELGKIESGVVSITGFATAFAPETRLEDSLRVLNFNRENLVPPNLRQIWWLPSSFAEIFVPAVPDLDSWFTVRLYLTETLASPSPAPMESEYDERALDRITNIPSQDISFVGRDDALSAIESALESQRTVVIYGIGGIGKTQTAFEYARRHQENYKAQFWTIADNEDSLVRGLLRIAVLLDLPGIQGDNESIAVGSARHWLDQNEDWLLILDEVTDPHILASLLRGRISGHIIVTSRRNILTSSPSVQLSPMTREESLTLLFNRTHLVPANDREQRAAEDIAVGLDYLPLSLELAGAYIQTERVTYDDYWKAYLQTAPSKERVETTLLVSFSKLKKPANQLAKLCSFFSADEIPFQLLRKSIDLLPEFNKDTPSFDWMTDIVGVLIAHSLVRSDVSSQTCSMHRYIQTGLRHLMDKEEQRLWAERAVKVTSQLFSLSIADWSQRERLLPTAFVAADLIENWDLESKEAAALLAALGTYLNERAQFTRAEPLLRRALRLTSRTEDRSSEVVILGALAGLYYEQGRYNEATSFINQALNFQETLVGPDDPEIAKTLRSLAQVNAQKGNYEEAQSILLRSLQIQIGHNSEPREIVETLNLLAWTYFEQKKYADAEHHFRFALEVGENALASKNPAVARSLRGLARSYLAEAKYEEAKSAYERLISIKAPQPDSEFAASLTELAYIYINERDYLEAKSLLERALAIQQQMGLMGQVANTLNNLALIYSHEGRYEEAERNLKHALDIQERVFGLGNASVVRTWENYAAILRQLGRDEEARVFEERAKRISPRQTAIN